MAPPRKQSPQRPGTEAKSAARFAEILDASAELFSVKGYAATTTKDVAEAVGVLKGSIYYYIDAKEDLLFAIIEDVWHAASAAQDAAAQGPDPLENIREFLVAHTRTNAKLATKAAVFYQEAARLEGDRRETIRRWRSDYEDRLKALFKKAAAAGLLRDGVDTSLAARAALGMVNAMHQWYRPGGKQSPDALGHAFADLVLEGTQRRDS